MAAPWYAAATTPRDDAAWEVYHENSKRGPRDSSGFAGLATPSFDHGALPVLEPVAASTPAGAATAARSVSYDHLLRLLAAGGTPFGPDDPTLVFIHLAAVDGLPAALAAYDPATPCLRLLAADVPGDRVAAAAGTPDAFGAAAAIVFVAADLDAATARAGERGYREALIAAGRHLAAFEAVATLPLAVRVVPFLDREADTLLFLDGLSQSVLAVLAVEPTG